MTLDLTEKIKADDKQKKCSRHALTYFFLFLEKYLCKLLVV